jgi:FMN-dependent NADH-azoreductase
MKLLRIDSSARGRSVSRQLTSRFVEEWKKQNPTGQVVERDLADLADTPLPHITDDFPASSADLSTLSSGQRQYLVTSDLFVDELLSSDTVVIGSPMYNFTISWELKAWIDQIVRLGRTVVYGANGPKGLVSGKKVVVITSRGGGYAAGSPRSRFDFQEPYLRHIFHFIGLTDVEFIHAENQYRKDQAQAGRTVAVQQIVEAVSPNV